MMTNTNSRRVPLDKRKRTETSCDKCKSRKQKCRKDPGQDSCRYCQVHGIECQTTQPRKQRLYGSVEGLGNRLALLEAMVKGLLPEADLSNLDEMRQLGISLGIPLPDAGDTETKATESDENLPLIPDQQGQVQYIGPASSFQFHRQLRSLVGKEPFTGFVLFGANAADQDAVEETHIAGTIDQQALSTPSNTSNLDYNSPPDRTTTTSGVEGPSLEALIITFFDHINPDFPVLHEASFREAYEGWVTAPSSADPPWLCSLLCLLILARRVAHVTFPAEQERLWWRKAQTLLPVVVFTSSVHAVQALMLAALHLHNTNHRDACWNLTGTAVRIAFAIGLHQDKVNTMLTPLNRELRKRLWWTLYAFEQMQVSSYDRPSTIEPSVSKTGCPNERLIGMAGYTPPDYTRWFNRLTVLLASSCRASKTAKAGEESYIGPLSPAAGILRDLNRWKESLPAHLGMEVVDASPSSFQRPLLLLHAMYHYTVTVLSRTALLQRATAITKDGKDSQSSALTGMSTAAVDSGQWLAKALVKLDTLNRFDVLTWWDIWYSLASASLLVLDIVCCLKTGAEGEIESKTLLQQLATAVEKRIRHSQMPGTIYKWATLVLELRALIEPPLAPPDSVTMADVKTVVPEPPSNEPIQNMPIVPQYSQPIQSVTNSGAFLVGDNILARYNTEPHFPSPGWPQPAGQRPQAGYADYTLENIPSWNWEDIGALLGEQHHP